MRKGLTVNGSYQRVKFGIGGIEENNAPSSEKGGKEVGKRAAHGLAGTVEFAQPISNFAVAQNCGSVIHGCFNFAAKNNLAHRRIFAGMAGGGDLMECALAPQKAGM